MDSQSADCVETGTTGSSAISVLEVNPTNDPAMGAARVKIQVSRQQSKSQKQRSVKCHVFGCRHNLVKAYDKVSTII